MRKLGIDYGDNRVGIAITDPLNITVQGIETIYHKENDKIVLKNLVSADLKYFNSETYRFENWNMPKIGVILMKDENSHFVNILDYEDDIPIAEISSSILRKDGESNIKIIQGEEELKSGPCYLLHSEDLSCYFHGKDIISFLELERFILSRDICIKGRKKLAIKRLKEDPLRMFDVLISDSKKEKEFNKFLKDSNYKVYKK